MPGSVESSRELRQRRAGAGQGRRSRWEGRARSRAGPWVGWTRVTERSSGRREREVGSETGRRGSEEERSHRGQVEEGEKRCTREAKK